MKNIEVVAAIICKDDRIFAAQRGYGDFKDLWEFPGGKIEADEKPEDALLREVREELSAEILLTEKFCTVEYNYPKFRLIMHCYLCELLSDTLYLKEHKDSRWLTKEELHNVSWLPADQKVIELLKNKNSTNPTTTTPQ